MKVIKWATGLCLVSLMSVSALAGSASAASLLFVPNSGKYPYHMAGTGGEAILETVKKEKVEATSTDVLAQVTSATLANVKIEFLKAKAFGGLAKCGNDGKAETILVNLVSHLGFADPGIKPAAQMLVPSGFSFSCKPIIGSAKEIRVEGEVIGEISKPGIGVESEEMSLNFEQSGGVQKFTTFLTGSSTLTNQFEKTSLEGGAFEQSGQSGSATLKALSGEGKFSLVSP